MEDSPEDCHLVVRTIAGSGLQGYLDGNNILSQFNYPNGVAIDNNGNIIVADTNNHRIRKIDINGNVTTIAGNGTSSQFYSPHGISIDNKGNIIVTDRDNHRILKIDVNGNVTTIAGNGTKGYRDGNNLSSLFNHPSGVATDNNGNIIVADTDNNRIRKIGVNGKVTTIAGNDDKGCFNGPNSIAIDNKGNIFVADTGNNRIRKIDINNNVTTVAGSVIGYLDGNRKISQFNTPRSLSIDNNANIIVADRDNHAIRKIDVNYNTTTIAGNGEGGYLDGKSVSSQFNFPTGVAIDKNGNIIVADSWNHKIRMILSDTPKPTLPPTKSVSTQNALKPTPCHQYSAKAMDHIKQHLSEIRQKKSTKTRNAAISLLEERLEEDKLENDVNLFKNMEPILIDQIKDPFDFDVYSATWYEYFPNPKSSATPTPNKVGVPQKKTLPNQGSTTVLQERGNRREPPTARFSPGKRFLDIIPKALATPTSVIDGLEKYASENHLPIIIIEKFKEKIEDFTETNPPERAFAMALCWLYTTESWVYPQVNTQLRDDSSTMVSLAPYMKALIESYKNFEGDETNFYSGVVYRRTKLTQKGLEFYKPNLHFVWSAFTSTAIEFNPSGEFGSILFEITIPEKFKKYALCLENLSAFPTEREVLMLPNVAYRVVLIENNSDEYPNTTCVIKVSIDYVCVVL